MVIAYHMATLREPEWDARGRGGGVGNIRDKREEANRTVNELPALKVGAFVGVVPGQGRHGVRTS